MVLDLVRKTKKRTCLICGKVFKTKQSKYCEICKKNNKAIIHRKYALNTKRKKLLKINMAYKDRDLLDCFSFGNDND